MVFIVAGVSLVAVVLGVLSLARTYGELGGGPRSPGNEAFKAYRNAGLLAAGVVLALWCLSYPPLLMVLFGLAVLVVFAHAWLREFSFLMALSDKDFPGRYDKPIWAFVLVATGPVGLWLFHAHRAAHWPSADAAEAGPGRSTAADLF